MTVTARTIPDLRHLLTDAADQDRTPTEWALMAVMDLLSVVELLPLIELAEPRSHPRDLLARHARFLAGKACAAGLEMLDALEHTEGLTGPIGEERLSTAEAQEAVARLAAAAHAREVER